MADGSLRACYFALVVAELNDSTNRGGGLIRLNTWGCGFVAGARGFELKNKFSESTPK